MNAKQQVAATLKSIGAKLLRAKKHQIWQLPNGQKFVRACTPSDQRGDQNNLTELKHAAGLLDPERGQAGERRERKHKPGRMETSRTIHAAPVSDFAAKLSMSGAIEAGLRSEIESLNRQLAEALARECECWWCRFERWRKR